MAFKARVSREKLMRRLNELVPNAEIYAAEAKLEVVKEAANMISAAAPYDTGDYMSEIKGERQADNPNHAPIVGTQSKDPNATAVYAPFIWRFLEFGTKAHINKGRFAGTEHPGTAAQPHVFPTWRGYRKAAMKKVRDAINRAVREAQGR